MLRFHEKKNREQVRSPETGKETEVNEKLVNLHDTSDTWLLVSASASSDFGKTMQW